MIYDDIVVMFTKNNQAQIYTNDGLRKFSHFIIYKRRPRNLGEFCNEDLWKYHEVVEIDSIETFKDIIRYEFQRRNLHENIAREVRLDER